MLFPISVTHLTFGNDFNQAIKNAIPNQCYTFNFWSLF